MTRILFLPNNNTLLWLDINLPPDVILEEIQAGIWQPPAPFDNLPNERLSAGSQDGVVTITVANPGEVSTRSRASRLSRRQSEVLKGLAHGYTTRQIAHHLRVSTRMVNYLVAELKEIFQAQSRAELVFKANRDQLDVDSKSGDR